MKQRKKNDDLSRSIYQDNTEFKSPFFQGSLGFTFKEYFPKTYKAITRKSSNSNSIQIIQISQVMKTAKFTSNKHQKRFQAMIHIQKVLKLLDKIKDFNYITMKLSVLLLKPLQFKANLEAKVLYGLRVDDQTGTLVKITYLFELPKFKKKILASERPRKTHALLPYSGRQN